MKMIKKEKMVRKLQIYLINNLQTLSNAKPEER